ncbi:SAP domain-containing protein [Aspergillus melleus]|uniref:SAP domain-containing protein n=1 Tax=Aspergillus melleus TaxID=138277 RepID=UPI001E8E415E|nr:uncharacterized protein LDX57_005083 [Aspergillus melleus]KAH8427370.1 hypothetical protein LDX57_005083 [Aspergillus melleus]
MTTDYSKKTNAELVEILKSRSLPHTGKKAELVSRIQDDDAKTQPAESAPAAKADAEDVIDWEDDDEPAADAAAKPTTEAGAATIAAGGKGPVSNPVAVPNQKQDIDPATTDDLKVESQGEPKGDAPAQEGTEAEPADSSETAQPAEEKPVVDYSIGLATTELEEELKKRKARAEKFGITEETKAAVADAEKKLERAKRFGTEGGDKAGAGVEKLDVALPSENPRKRDRAENDQGERGDRKRHFGGRGHFRGRGHFHGRGGRGGRGPGRGGRGGRGRGGRGSDNHRGQRPHPNNASGLSEKDKAAMEARKKRFATE